MVVQVAPVPRPASLLPLPSFRPPFQLSIAALHELVGQFYRRTYVLLGFSQGFANWAEVEGWAEDTAARFDAVHGPGHWIVIYE